MPIKKIPPPPPLPDALQPLNRWLLELQSILNASGLINADNVENLPQTIIQVGSNTVDITALQNAVTALQNALTALAARVTALENALAALTVRVANLEARAQVLNGAGAPAAGFGNVNDWYADVSATKHIYVKTAAATWTLIV